MILKRIAYTVGVVASILPAAIAGPHRVLQDAYEIEKMEIKLTDVSTEITDIKAIHNGVQFEVFAHLKWADQIFVEGSSNLLNYEMLIDGNVENTGSVDLNAERELPEKISCGFGTMDTSGKHVVSVKVTIDASEFESDRDYQSFASGASFVPLIIVLLLAGTTHMVELALGMGLFVGTCMVAGSLTAGFRDMLDIYILGALADEDHCYVILFILFMAGLVGLMEKSGGLMGVTHALKGFVKTRRSSQIACFTAGVVIFFDDYANCLVAGYSMRALTDICGVSREKLAFIVDATAAPIASIIPISSWVGFEISLIQEQLDAIYERYPDPTISDSGFSVFLETIKYRYYCIFMLMFIPLLIASGRDFGPMLIAERANQVYGRTDGGDGAALAADGNVLESKNTPPDEMPKRWWNLALPIVMLVVYIFYLLAWTGSDPTNPDQTFVNVMEDSNSYQALLWGTMAAALTAVLFYFLQDYKDGRIIWFNFKGWAKRSKAAATSCCRKEDGSEEAAEDEARVLVDYEEAMSSFILGMEKIFGALVVLTLAWASGAIMQSVGLNRLFAAIINSPGLNNQMLPTISFVIAILIAFSTGTSWGTMTIMFPLIVVPSYEASGGNPVIVYGVIAGILAGAVAGDHASPISDTTILGAMASECKLINHVKTQAPYAFTVALWSILVGTIPSGMEAFGNGICTLLGLLAMAFHAFLTSAPAINKSGRFDIFTELYLMLKKDEYLLDLKEKTKQVAETGETFALPDIGEEIAKPLTGDDEELVKDQGEPVIEGDEDTASGGGAAEEAEPEEPAEPAEKAFGESVISA